MALACSSGLVPGSNSPGHTRGSPPQTNDTSRAPREKASEITLVSYQPSGRFGRLYLSGTESAVKVARDAAVRAIEALPGKPMSGKGSA